MTCKQALEEGKKTLSRRSGGNARVETELLLAGVLALQRIELYIEAHRELTSAEEKKFRQWLNERLSGKPVQYILGSTEFFGLTFRVNPSVLIPRPETEILVEVVLNFFREFRPPAMRTAEKGQSTTDPHLTWFLLDIGTGSGNISIALAKNLPNARLVATDVSKEALAVARENAFLNKVNDRITLLKSDLFEKLNPEMYHHQFDAIVSNPPYITEPERFALPEEVRNFEPEVALFSPASATYFHQKIIQQAPTYLKSGGGLFLETALGQAQQVQQAFQETPHYRHIQLVKDLTGIDRVAWATKTIN